MYMRQTLFLSVLFLLTIQPSAQTREESIKSIYDQALTNGEVYENLRFLCKEIGSRLSGSPEAAAAVEYTRQLMESYAFDSVYLQPVMVPHWIRGGKDIVRIVNSTKVGTRELNCLALGNAIGTGPGGLTGNVIEVASLAEIDEIGAGLKDKIVFINAGMDPTTINNASAYSSAVVVRAYGASEAGKHGAKAVVIRSITNRQDDIPHTGSLVYKPLMPRIPAFALSANDADLLSDLLDEQTDLSLYLESHGQQLPDVLSYNVVGEIRGTEFPDEIIVVGGHLDSWDVGEGAHDDGAGCMQAIEAARLLNELGLASKRTIRVVMWMNEENGLRGGREYARLAEENNENHIAALESDTGGFRPVGFKSGGTEAQQNQLLGYQEYFEPYGLWRFDERGGGADIGPLKSQGTFVIGLRPDSQRYWIHHHTDVDVFEYVDRRELELGAASMAALLYLLDQDGVD